MAENDQDLFQDQSNEPKGGSAGDGSPAADQTETFTLPDGRVVTGKEAYEEYVKLLPDYTKKSQELSELKKPSDKKDDLSADKMEVLKELKGLGVLTKEDFEAEKVKIRQEIEFENELKSLEKEINGSDGRPAFNKAEVLAHMQKEQIFNPLKAYKDMHEDKLTEFKIKQYLDAKKDIPSSEKNSMGSGKEPEPTPAGEKKFKRDGDVANAISEYFKGNNAQ